MNHNRVAASVRQAKEKNPEKFCPVANCLWRMTDGKRCPN